MYSRRQFVRITAPATVASIFAPQTIAQGFASTLRTPLFRDGKFSDGVSAGDPTPNGTTLWTRVDEVDSSGRIELEVSTDSDFRKVVLRDQIATSSRNGHTVKARVSDLNPHTRYYYRFSTKNESSQVGRFQTALPEDSSEPVRFGYFSCQDYCHGFFNAQALMAKEDLDFIVCLGDFIYAEDGQEIYDDPLWGVGFVRDEEVGTAYSLNQYRRKYQMVRSDPNLRALLANFSMVGIWDDHELHDDAAWAGKDSGGSAAKRRRAATRAYFENMPMFPVGGSKSTRIYRSMRFGKNVELLMLDERQYREDQPCNDSAFVPACSDLNKPRKFLGDKQMEFTKQTLLNSQANWKLVGNEVMIMGATLAEYYLTFDPWQGYPQERQELLDFIQANNIRDVHFLTGDIHILVTGNVLASDGQSVGCEFIGGSCTSASLGELSIDLGEGKQFSGNDFDPQTPDYIIDMLQGANPHIKWADLDHHGYGIVDANTSEMTVTYRRLKTIKSRSLSTLEDVSWTLQRGQRGIS